MLGLALCLWLEVEAWINRGDHGFTSLTGTADTWPREENLLHQAFDAGREALGQPPLSLCAQVHSQIPVGRGLGSSGAAIAAGLALAVASAGEPPARLEELTSLACKLDGHPDNTTASLLGGCTLAVPCDGELVILRQQVHADIAFSVAWPAQPLSTREARAVLPREVPFDDAVANPRRLALLLEGLRTGEAQLLALGIEDRLHVSRRLALIPGGAAALAAAREAGAFAATVSGSGSALIALGPRESAEAVANAMAAKLESSAGPSVARHLEAAEGPPSLTPLP